MVWCVCMRVYVSVRECMCVLCVRDMYMQRCRHAPEHTHIHILIQTLMYGDLKQHGM